MDHQSLITKCVNLFLFLNKSCPVLPNDLSSLNLFQKPEEALLFWLYFSDMEPMLIVNIQPILELVVLY